MRVRWVAFPLAALPVALSLGCQGQPGVRIATDGPARDAGADRASDRGAARVDATGIDRSGQDAFRFDANRLDANRLDANRLDANRLDGAAVDRPIDGKSTDAASAAGGDGGGSRTFELLGAPMVFAPTPRGFGLSVVLRSGDPTSLQLRVRDEQLSAWSLQGPPFSRA